MAAFLHNAMTTEASCDSSPIDLQQTRADTCDLATGERVHIITTPMGGESEQAQWAERCAWLSRASHPRWQTLLVDFGVLDERHRFEAWAAHPGWTGSPRAAATRAQPCKAAISRWLPTHAGVVRSHWSARGMAARHHSGMHAPAVSRRLTSGRARERGVLGVVRDADPRAQRLASS